MENNNSQIDYDEVEKLMPSRVNEVKAVLKNEHNLDVPPECDGFIVRCLRTKDGVLDKTIKLIIAFRQTIIDFEKWDATLQPTLYEEFYNSFAVSPLLQRDSQGRPLVCFRFYMWDPEKMNFDEVIFVCWMIGQCLVKDSIEVQRNGFAIILDCSNFTLRHAWAMKHWRLLSVAKWMQNGIVGRIKGIHIVFHSRIVRAIYTAVKPFLKEKLKKRIFFHDNVDNLHEFVNPQGLPKYLGGELEPHSDECIDKHFIKELLLQDTYFKDIAVRSFPTK